MDRELLGQPLRHALMVLWTVGLIQLAMALNRAGTTVEWAVTAALGALVALLITERLRRLELVPVAVVLVAAAVLGAAHVSGFEAPTVLATLLAATALGIWQSIVFVSPSHLLHNLVQGLRPADERTPEPSGQVEGVVHATCIALSAIALVGGSVVSAVTNGIAIHLPVLAICLVFMWLTTSRYRRPWQAHGFVALCALGAVALYLTLTGPASTQTGELQNPLAFVFDAGVAFVLSLFAALALVATRLLRSSDPQATQETAPTKQSLATVLSWPLELAACTLALIALALLGLIIVADTFDTPGWTIAATLVVVATVLLVANHAEHRPVLTPLGVCTALLGIAWVESAFVHGATPLGLWPFGPAGTGRWVALAALGVAASWLAVPARASSGWKTYVAPLQIAGISIQVWAFAGACALLAGFEARTGAIFGLLMLGALAPVRDVALGSLVRSVALVILATGVWAALLGPPTLERLAWPLLAVWGFVLWGIAHGVLKRFNRRWPPCTLAAAGLVWPGLMFVLAGAAIGLARGGTDFDIFASIVVIAAYAFVMTRDSAWRGFEHISAAALVGAGWTTSVLRNLDGALSLELASLGTLALETMLWANAVLVAVALWNRYRLRFSEHFDWRAPSLRAPVLRWVFGLCTIWVACLGAVETARWLGLPATTIALQVPVWLLALFAITVAHVYRYLRHELVAHVLIAALVCVASALWWSVEPSALPLLMAGCGVLLMLFLVSPWAHSEWAASAQSAAKLWFAFLAAGSLAVSALMPGTGELIRSASFAIVTAATGWYGLRHGGRMWLYGATAALVGLLHITWRIWLPETNPTALLPWFVAEVTALAWGAKYWSAARATESGNEVHEALIRIWPWLAGLATVEWILLLATSIASLGTAGTWEVIGGPAGHAAAVAGSLALAWICVRHARHPGADAWMYAAAAFAASTMIYIRLTALGLAPPGPADTAAIIGASYALFALHSIWRSRALWHLTMIVPLLAIATVPFQLGSAHGAITLAAIGTLYLLARRSSGAGTPLYLGLIAINASIYLWVPQWSDRIGLVQLYVFPTALTVLWLLHLHRRELNPTVLASAQLAALATLYAAAGVDVFLQDSIAVFVLALGLSLVGIALGIGLRVRAFLYAGVAFLILNVVGQMLVFYPEHRLARAAILMGLGVSITGAMVWFSLKRELVLERVRLIRADLAEWS